MDRHTRTCLKAKLYPFGVGVFSYRVSVSADGKFRRILIFDSYDERAFQGTVVLAKGILRTDKLSLYSVFVSGDDEGFAGRVLTAAVAAACVERKRSLCAAQVGDSHPVQLYAV